MMLKIIFFIIQQFYKKKILWWWMLENNPGLFYRSFLYQCTKLKALPGQTSARYQNCKKYIDKIRIVSITNSRNVNPTLNLVSLSSFSIVWSRFKIGINIKNNFLHLILKVSFELFSQSRGIESFKADSLFERELSPTFWLLFFIIFKFLCQDVKICSKFSVVRSIE